MNQGEGRRSNVCERFWCSNIFGGLLSRLPPWVSSPSVTLLRRFCSAQCLREGILGVRGIGAYGHACARAF